MASVCGDPELRGSERAGGLPSSEGLAPSQAVKREKAAPASAHPLDSHGAPPERVGELWPTEQRFLDVQLLTPRKAASFTLEGHISASTAFSYLGVCPTRAVCKRDVVLFSGTKMRGSLKRKNQRNANKYLLSETEYKTKFQLNWKTEQNKCMSETY